MTHYACPTTLVPEAPYDGYRRAEVTYHPSCGSCLRLSDPLRVGNPYLAVFVSQERYLRATALWRQEQRLVASDVSDARVRTPAGGQDYAALQRRDRSIYATYRPRADQLTHIAERLRTADDWVQIAQAAGVSPGQLRHLIDRHFPEHGFVEELWRGRATIDAHLSEGHSSGSVGLRFGVDAALIEQWFFTHTADAPAPLGLSRYPHAGG